MKKGSIISSVLFILAVFAIPNTVVADQVRGVTDTEIKLSCLVDFSGPGKFAGPPLAMGAQTYINYVNAQGGIHGRKVKLFVEDNGILPNTTLIAAKKAIFKDEIFAIGFNLGSSSSSAIIPLCEENKVVLLPHGANKRFYSPGHKLVFVPHSTLFNMASRAVEYILEKNPKAKIGIIYQDDDMGRDGLNGARAAAKFMKIKLVKEAAIKIGTIDLSTPMRIMKEADVDYLIVWSYLPQVAASLKEKAKMNWGVKIIGNNGTAYRLIFPLIGDLAEGYLAMTPIAPWEDVSQKVKGIIRKHGDFEKINKYPFPAPLFLGSWVYFVAMVEGLKQAGRNLTPETLVKGLESIKNLDMNGVSPNISFGPKMHAGYFSSRVLRADAKNKRFVIESPIKEPKTPQW